MTPMFVDSINRAMTLPIIEVFYSKFITDSYYLLVTKYIDNGF